MKLNELIENEMNEFLSIYNNFFSNEDGSKGEKVVQKLSAIKPFVNDTEEKEKITQKDKNKG